jgi:hypothetical protein
LCGKDAANERQMSGKYVAKSRQVRGYIAAKVRQLTYDSKFAAYLPQDSRVLAAT